MAFVYFNGKAGRLEGKYVQSTHPEPQVALILHSEPEKGGSMDDEVVDQMYRLFAKHNFSVLKLNFRGVGKSQKSENSKDQYIKDATAAMDWLHSKNMESKDFWVVGFSSGARTAFHLVMRRPEIREYIMISPMLKKDLGFIVPCEAGGLIIHPENNVFTTEENTNRFVEKLSVKEGLEVEYAVISGADHSFTDSAKMSELRETVDDYIKRKTIENMGRVIKIKRDRRRRRRKKQKEEYGQLTRVPPIQNIDFE